MELTPEQKEVANEAYLSSSGAIEATYAAVEAVLALERTQPQQAAPSCYEIVPVVLEVKHSIQLYEVRENGKHGPSFLNKDDAVKFKAQMEADQIRHSGR